MSFANSTFGIGWPSFTMISIFIAGFISHDDFFPDTNINLWWCIVTTIKFRKSENDYSTYFFVLYNLTVSVLVSRLWNLDYGVFWNLLEIYTQTRQLSEIGTCRSESWEFIFFSMKSNLWESLFCHQVDGINVSKTESAAKMSESLVARYPIVVRQFRCPSWFSGSVVSHVTSTRIIETNKQKEKMDEESMNQEAGFEVDIIEWIANAKAGFNFSEQNFWIQWVREYSE